MREFRVQGPPGTGKTTFIKGQVARAAAAYGNNQVVVCSLTRSAASHVAAAAENSIPRENIGTIHSLANRAIGGGDVAEGNRDKWNEWCKENGLPNFSFSEFGDGKPSPDDDIIEVPTSKQNETPGDKNYAEMNRLRARMADRKFWPDSVRGFADAWNRWKREAGLIDFTDMLEVALRDVAECPGKPAALFADEAQDFSRLAFAVARKWGEKAMRFILVGDPDQCQAGDALVLTSDGLKRMDSLDPLKDKLICYDKGKCVITSQNTGFNFELASRPYNGKMITVSVGLHKSESTPDHRWPIRWNTNDTSKNIVYLMRSGEKWRVGWCQLFNSEGSWHLGQRARLERADAAWILKVFDFKSDASIYESIIATKYGIFTVPFVERPGHYTQENLNRIFESIDAIEQAKRADACLTDHGRSIAHPIYGDATIKRGIHGLTVVRACNLLPGVMWMMDSAKTWQPITGVESSDFIGDVYSVNVEPHHNYFSDGLLTCNCLYQWSGVDPAEFDASEIPKEQRRTLAQSFRVPRAVHKFAVDWINQTPKRTPVEYRPRDFEGSVRRDVSARFADPERAVIDAERQLDNGKSVMFCAACAYMLTPVIEVLKGRGIPFHNPYRVSRGDWNPLNGRGVTALDRIMAFLKCHPTGGKTMWTYSDCYRWIDWMETKSGLVRGAKTQWKVFAETMPAESVDISVLISWFEMFSQEKVVDVDFDWWLSCLPPAKRAKMVYPKKIIDRFGYTAAEEVPRVIVSTIHAAKGGEADVVYLFPDLSPQGYSEWLAGGGGKEGIRRAFYVGMTRPRETLVIMPAGSNMAVRI